ncbi:hypothetical protein DID75_01415 [Candidatus Marinamargulisbacteria bacterium SCGC AG-410-N11]|nr:hypothetical protein DID75_01415 [Candidatus Marinamargulisbacteria bacterium SCGC AG-410-N11]
MKKFISTIQETLIDSSNHTESKSAIHLATLLNGSIEKSIERVLPPTSNDLSSLFNDPILQDHYIKSLGPTTCSSFLDTRHQALNSLEKLKQRISYFKNNETVIIADMTKTILFQEEDTIRPRTAQALLSLFKQNMPLVLVTSDSIHTVSNHFLSSIKQANLDKVFLVCGSGHDIYRIQNHFPNQIYEGKCLSKSHKETLLEIMICVAKEFDPNFRLTEQNMQLLTSEQGGKVRLTINHVLESSNHDSFQIFVEMRGGKWSIFLPKNSPSAMEFIKKVANDWGVKRIQNHYRFHKVLDYDFFEITASNKMEGLQTLHPFFITEITQTLNNAIVFGDSKNDIELFKFPFHQWLSPINQNNLIKVFVGTDKNVYDTFKEPNNSFMLTGRFVEGTTDTLEFLAQNRLITEDSKHKNYQELTTSDCKKEY